MIRSKTRHVFFSEFLVLAHYKIHLKNLTVMPVPLPHNGPAKSQSLGIESRDMNLLKALLGNSDILQV